MSLDASAAPKDSEAEKLYEQAMDEDYLNVQFDNAIAKLKKALGTCGKGGCSREVLGKLYVALGVIYGGGKNNNAEAKAYFIKAFEVDPNAKPLEDYMSPELKKIFAQAKSEAKPAAGDDDVAPQPQPQPKGDDGDKPPPQPKGDDDDEESAEGGIEYDPPAEGLINTPLPIYIEFPEDISAAGAMMRYKPFGGTKWIKLNMRRMGEGYGAEIPCGEITTTGELKLYIIAQDDGGDPIATAGTRKRPLSVNIKNKLTGSQPAFPGKKAPEQCVTAADCPPDFPGCEPTTGGDRGDKGWGASCESTKECRAGLVCLNGSCEQGEGGDDDDSGAPAGPLARKHFVWLGGQLDALFLKSAQNVCGTQTDSGSFEAGPDNYFCYHTGEDRIEGEFLGLPAEADNTNEVLGGGALAGGRILAGYDYMVWDGGIAVGARIGVGFSTSPGVGDAQDRFEECVEINGEVSCREPAAKSFLMFHGEVRGTYFIGGSEGFLDGMIRPYAFVGGGVGQVNAGVNVRVCDRVDADNANAPAQSPDNNCRSASGNTIGRDDIKAVQVTGLGFADVGVGSIFAFHPNFGAFAELKVMFMLPTFGAVLAPTIGPAAMF